MSTAWSLNELRAHAHQTSDTMALELIDSVSRSITIFQYHAYTARDALQGVLNYENPQGVDNFKYIFGGSDRQDEFLNAMVVSEASLISCIHTTRSLLETFAQLINRTILLGVIEVSKCTPKIVATKLPDGELKTKLQDILTSYWFSYTSAFTNTVKHRQLIQHQITISFEDDAVGIKVGAFNYERATYPVYLINEVLHGAFSVKNKIIALGRILNRTLQLGEA